MTLKKDTWTNIMSIGIFLIFAIGAVKDLSDLKDSRDTCQDKFPDMIEFDRLGENHIECTYIENNEVKKEIIKRSSE